MIAGIIANIFKNILGAIFYFTNVKNYYIWQLPTSTYLPEEQATTLEGMLLVGFPTDYMVAATIGIFALFLFIYYDFKYLIPKGILIGALTWLIVFSVVRFGVTGITPDTILGGFASMIEHIFFGIILAITLKKITPSSLIKN